MEQDLALIGEDEPPEFAEVFYEDAILGFFGIERDAERLLDKV